jgi:hypothetical protein
VAILSTYLAIFPIFIIAYIIAILLTIIKALSFGQKISGLYRPPKSSDAGKG